MINTLVAVVCQSAIMINLSKEPWVKIDYVQLHVSAKRCEQLYPDAPCLKKFIKTEPRAYRAICGI